MSETIRYRGTIDRGSGGTCLEVLHDRQPRPLFVPRGWNADAGGGPPWEDLFTWGDRSASTRASAMAILSHATGGAHQEAHALRVRFVDDVLSRLRDDRPFVLKEADVGRWLKAEGIEVPDRSAYTYRVDLRDGRLGREGPPLLFKAGAVERYEIPHVAGPGPYGASRGHGCEAAKDAALSILSHATGYSGWRDDASTAACCAADLQASIFSDEVVSRRKTGRAFTLPHAEVESWLWANRGVPHLPATLRQLEGGLPEHVKERLQPDGQLLVLEAPAPLVPPPAIAPLRSTRTYPGPELGL